MSSIIDKVILITISSIALLSFVEATVAIYYIILIIGISSLLEVLKNSKKQIILLIVYCIASYFFPFIIIFIGVIIYDFLDKRYLFGLFIITILINLDKISLNFFNIIIVSIIVAIIEKIRTDNFIKKKNEFIYKRDSLTETAINLKNKIELILNKQDSDVQIATLNERNRIAREIHDTVGHLLTSSILQLGAIKTTVNDEKVSEGLNQLQETISEGMNSVRHSIHNLRDESIDIDAQLNKIISEFNFCDINF
ncbi:MAG TPA: histidine kinase, partial [Clostridiales bacterium]|nr:histidine kinase [Clostridiales bacterium]